MPRFWLGTAKQIVLSQKRCRINALDSVASTGCAGTRHRAPRRQKLASSDTPVRLYNPQRAAVIGYTYLSLRHFQLTRLP